MLDQLLGEGAPPIAAILRGLRPEEALAVGGALMDAGLRIMEVPLNSPDPFASIAAMAAAFGREALVGAGTVLRADAVDRLHEAGGRLLVTPNTDPAVIARGAALRLDMLPGFMTPTEAFCAIDAGATRLKLFPAGRLGPSYVKAVRDVLPRAVGMWAVGGAGVDTIGDWREAGCEGVGVGGALYRPGDEAAQVRDRAAALVAAWRTWKG